MKTARMFFGEGAITHIDYATIDNKGKIVGGSLTPTMIVEGPVSADEAVVIDFSTGKKHLKALIDDKEEGLDHKLIIGSWSKIDKVLIETNYVYIETPHWVIEMPRNAVHVNSTEDSSLLDIYTFDQVLKDYLEPSLQKTHPDVTLSIQCTDKVQGLPYFNHFAPFRYTHGLKNSTSWGCQNIAHGHLSYIFIGAEDEVGAKILANKMARFYDNNMFVWEDNWSKKDHTVSYDTERGHFSLKNKGAANVIALSPVETTIENLVEMMVVRFEDELKEIFAYEVFVSEGLAKGASYRLDLR